LNCPIRGGLWTCVSLSWFNGYEDALETLCPKAATVYVHFGQIHVFEIYIFYLFHKIEDLYLKFINEQNEERKDLYDVILKKRVN